MKRILIVGGGTAGWLAAINLNRIVRRLRCEVVLVESADIGTIGVGEATVPTLVHMMRMLELNEQEMMRRCSATFKLGIRFEGWAGEGVDYWHPFGGSGAAANLDLFHFWLKRRLERDDCGRYSDYSLQAHLTERGAGPGPDVVRAAGYAYHLDAAAFAQYLKEISVAEGVRHVFGTIGAVALTENGDIASIDIGGDRRMEADLFVDASGFTGLLIEQQLKDPWIDWSHQLLCDRAIAMPLPADPVKVPYTRACASSAGWMWRIPLTNRTGTGYVYSSAHVRDDDSAADALIAVSDLPKRRTADPRFLKIKVGRRTEFWKRNCIAVGLASGFVEPLESTGIHLIQKAITLLVDHFPTTGIAPALRDHFNREMGRAYDEVRDFILLHYVAANRDEPFWMDAKRVALPDSAAALLALYDACGLVDLKNQDLFPESSYHYILAGSGRLPKRPIARVDALNVSAVNEPLVQRRTQIARIAAAAGSHDDLLAQIHKQAI